MEYVPLQRISPRVQSRLSSPSDASVMQSNNPLEQMMGYRADVSLAFLDGTVAACSGVLGLYSTVLNNAVKRASTRSIIKEGSKKRPAAELQQDAADTPLPTIPMPGVKKQEWLTVAAFIYPVLPPPAIADFKQLGTLLKVALQLDIKVLLHKVDDYLSSNSDKLVADRNSDRSVWKWLLEADKAGLQKSLDALTARAAAVDSAGCKSMSSFDGLSQLALKKLIVSCAGLIR